MAHKEEEGEKDSRLRGKILVPDPSGTLQTVAEANSFCLFDRAL